MKFKLLNCLVANRDHTKSKRQYAHSLHVEGVICVCSAFWDLPDKFFFGILAHEIGHMYAAEAGLESTEEEADMMAEQQLDVTIRYTSSVKYGDALEFLTDADISKIRKMIVSAPPRRRQKESA
jgi:hypothetical protein